MECIEELHPGLGRSQGWGSHRFPGRSRIPVRSVCDSRSCQAQHSSSSSEMNTGRTKAGHKWPGLRWAGISPCRAHRDEAPALSWVSLNQGGVSPSKAPPASNPGSGKELLRDIGEQEIRLDVGVVFLPGPKIHSSVTIIARVY